MEYDPNDDSKRTEFLRQEAERYRGAIPELLHAHIDDEEVRELQAPLPIIATPLPLATFIDVAAASVFLEAALSWGETGWDLVTRMQQNGKDQTLLSIQYQCEDVARESMQVFNRTDFLVMLDKGIAAGLLISGQSRGYKENAYMSLEDVQTVFRVNAAPEVHQILMESNAEGSLALFQESESFDLRESQELISEAPFFRSELGFRADLTAMEFYRFFDQPRVLESVVLHPDFYPLESGVKPYGQKTHIFCEGQVRAAFATGLLLQVEVKQGVSGFILSKQGKELLDSIGSKS